MGGHTVTKLGLLVHLRVVHTSLTSHAPEVGQGQNVGLRNFYHSLTLLPPGASVFHKHMSSFQDYHSLQDLWPIVSTSVRGLASLKPYT